MNISVGMTNVHSTEEQIAISDMEKACALVLEMIRIHAKEDER